MADKLNNVSVASELPRLILVVPRPIQHFCPMYRDIAESGLVDLKVVFVESGGGASFDKGFNQIVEWQHDLLIGFNYEVLQSTSDSLSKQVKTAIAQFSPNVVYVHGYHRDYLRSVITWCNTYRIPVCMTTDSELLQKRPIHISLIKKLTLPILFKGVDSLLTVGDENERYFKCYGVSSAKFERVPFSIDSRCYDLALERREEVRNRVRMELGIHEDHVVFLNVGKLVPWKRQIDLVECFKDLVKNSRFKGVLILAGDGPDRSDLEELARSLGNRVRFLGFVGVDKLPEIYIGSDVYVHPSSIDPHPLAISEACYTSLPIVTSDRVGSVGPTDDVQPGKNGWVYPMGDVSALKEILAKLDGDKQIRMEAGRASRELGLVHRSENCAALFIKAIQKLASKPRPSRRH